MVRVCCVCRRLHRDGEWIEADLPADELPTHGYCPDCASVARVELELMRYRDLHRQYHEVDVDSAVA